MVASHLHSLSLDGVWGGGGGRVGGGGGGYGSLLVSSYGKELSLYVGLARSN
jgi:hypothetical protein